MPTFKKYKVISLPSKGSISKGSLYSIARSGSLSNSLDICVHRIAKHNIDYDDIKNIIFCNGGNCKVERQNLYIISDEEIKEGDWYCHSFEGEIIDVRQCKKSEGRLDYKIIATTNISLQAKIPKIPQSFIEEYCKKGGIEEVEVEIIKCCSRCSEALGDECQGDTTKVNPHNEIIIHPAKDSWSREEVKELCKKAHSAGCKWQALSNNGNHTRETVETTEIGRWLDRNL